VTIASGSTVAASATCVIENREVQGPHQALPREPHRPDLRVVDDVRDQEQREATNAAIMKRRCRSISARGSAGTDQQSTPATPLSVALTAGRSWTVTLMSRIITAQMSGR
jgi:hypothetical protein